VLVGKVLKSKETEEEGDCPGLKQKEQLGDELACTGHSAKINDATIALIMLTMTPVTAVFEDLRTSFRRQRVYANQSAAGYSIESERQLA
jgi:hypothetical protein